MERALKERIIGAAVLVALAVVVVPVFLDGPPAGGEVLSERVPLPGQDEQASQTIVLERNRSEPVPTQAASAPVQESPAPVEVEPTVPVQEPASTRKPEAAARDSEPAAATPSEGNRKVPPVASDAASASPTGMFAVQLGSFSSKENAEKLAAELRRQGFAAFLSQLDTASAQLHRVRIGPQKDRQAAEAMAARLAKAGHQGQVVPHP
jgi:DedD protein